MTRKTIVHPAQNHRYSSNARGRHPRGCSTGVGHTRRHPLVPRGVKFITNSSRYNAQRDKRLGYCRFRARRSAASVRSLCQFDHESLEAHCAFCGQPLPVNDLGNDHAQSRALASGGTARAVRLPDPLDRCTQVLVSSLLKLTILTATFSVGGILRFSRNPNPYLKRLKTRLRCLSSSVFIYYSDLRTTTLHSVNERA